MGLKSELLCDVHVTRRFFDNTTGVLAEEDGGFRATPESMTVIAHIAHAAQTVDWFREGALHDRWRTDWEAMAGEVAAIESLGMARQRLAEAWDRLRAAIEAMPEEELAATMPENPIMPGRARAHAVAGVVDHTAHHRGALAVYARLLGRTPPMPYEGV